MSVERTEEDGEAGLLRVTMGGTAYQLAALTIEQSDEWLGALADALAGLETIKADTGTDVIRALMVRASTSVATLVAAYDRAGVLGGIDAIRAHMTKRELHGALELMVTVEDPFGKDAAHSVAVAFGLPSRMVEAGLTAVDQAVLRSVSSRTSRSMSGAATTPATSAPSGPASSSSSAGRTPRPVSRAVMTISRT